MDEYWANISYTTDKLTFSFKYNVSNTNVINLLLLSWPKAHYSTQASTDKNILLIFKYTSSND